jgi:hypothetical protein
MSEVETFFVCWPVGVALSCWLFFEIMKRGSRVERSLVPLGVVARPISPKYGALSDARRRRP